MPATVLILEILTFPVGHRYGTNSQQLCDDVIGMGFFIAFKP